MRSAATERRAKMETDPQAAEVLDEYVAAPNRSDIEWLYAVSDWCRTEATRLEDQLSG
jgi:hypothetical protein